MDMSNGLIDQISPLNICAQFGVARRRFQDAGVVRTRSDHTLNGREVTSGGHLRKRMGAEAKAATFCPNV